MPEKRGRLEIFLVIFLFLIPGCKQKLYKSEAYPYQVNNVRMFEDEIKDIEYVINDQDECVLIIANLNQDPSLKFESEYFIQSIDLEFKEIYQRLNISTAPLYTEKFTQFNLMKASADSAIEALIGVRTDTTKYLLHASLTNNTLDTLHLIHIPKNIDSNKAWDCRPWILELTDSEKLPGIFFINYGHYNDAPREILLLDSIKPFKVRSRIQLSAPINSPQLYDIDEDQIPEFLFATAAPYNGPHKGYGIPADSAGGKIYVYEDMPDDHAYYAAFDLNGERRWFTDAGEGGGHTVFFSSADKKDLYGIRVMTAFLDDNTRYNQSTVHQLDPLTGEIIREKRFEGKVFNQAVESSDSLRWLLNINKNNNTIQWISRKFEKYGKARHIANTIVYLSTIQAKDGQTLHAVICADQTTLLLNQKLQTVGVLPGHIRTGNNWQAIPDPSSGDPIFSFDFHSTSQIALARLTKVPWIVWRFERHRISILITLGVMLMLAIALYIISINHKRILLTRENQHYMSVFEEASEAIISMKLDSEELKLLKANNQFYDYFRIKKLDFSGLGSSLPEFHFKVINAVKSVLTKDKASRTDIDLEDGRIVRAYIVPLAGEKNTVVAVLHDITNEMNDIEYLSAMGHTLKTLTNITNWSYSRDRLATAYFQLMDAEQESAVNKSASSEIGELPEFLKDAMTSLSLFALPEGVGHLMRLAGSIENGYYGKLYDWIDNDSYKKSDPELFFNEYSKIIVDLLRIVTSGLGFSDIVVEEYNMKNECSVIFNGRGKSSRIRFNPSKIQCPPFRRGSDVIHAFVALIFEPTNNAIKQLRLDENIRQPGENDMPAKLLVQVKRESAASIALSIGNLTTISEFGDKLPKGIRATASIVEKTKLAHYQPQVKIEKTGNNFNRFWITMVIHPYTLADRISEHKEILLQ